MEVLDVDMGGGGGGAQGSFAGTGGGFNYNAPNGQWGTKRLNAQESLSSRSSDVGQEKRETFSFSTQLSQMYHLLDSYHLGTNRVVFFIQPRPHTLEEPSGFVRGPRPVDGIQEFFMVVAQPKDQKDFCVSLRLDTSHLAKTPVMDYERKPDISDLATAKAPIPTTSDIKAERKKLGEACLLVCWDIYYQCYVTHAVDDKVYQAPVGFKIEGFDDLVNNNSNGSSSVIISPDGSSLSIHAEAGGHNCYEDADSGCVNCDDNKEKWDGYANRQVQVNLVSTTPTKQIREDEVLMITTRGLCCCKAVVNFKPMDEHIVLFKEIPSELSVINYLNEKTRYVDNPNKPGNSSVLNSEIRSFKDDGCKDCNEKAKLPKSTSEDIKYIIRQTNELSNFIKTETIKSLNDPFVKLQKFVDTDFFSRQLEHKLIQIKKGRELLNQPVANDLPKEILTKLENYFEKDIGKITRHDLLAIRPEKLSEISGMKIEDVRRFRLVSLGIEFNTDEPYSIEKSYDEKTPNEQK